MSKRRQVPAEFAVAACSHAVQLTAGNLATVQVMPDGRFYPADGRTEPKTGWYMDAALAQQMIERWRAKKTPIVVDYEHQTLHKDNNGQPAPAAAWFKELDYRAGEGLFAVLELTDAAQKAVASREYQFFSPVFSYNPKTGAVLDLKLGALTNSPAIDGMRAVTLAAACAGAFTKPETENPEDHMNLLALLLSALGMPEDTKEEDAVAALNARIKLSNDAFGALGVTSVNDPEAVVAACTAMKAKVDAGNDVDPSKFVPVAALQSVQQQVAALNARLQQQETSTVESKITEALEDGRLIAGPMEDWARSLAKKDVAALNQFLDTAKPIAALQRSQTQGKPPKQEDDALTADELAVCSAMGVTEEEYKKARA